MKLPKLFPTSLGSHLLHTKKAEPTDTKPKPQEVTIVSSGYTKAAMLRDWVTASFFALFTFITVNDKFLTNKPADSLDSIVRNLDLNKDGHISRDEIETVRKLVDLIEKEKKQSSLTDTQH